MDDREPGFSSLDEPTQPISDSYALPLPEWNRAVALAQWMSDLDTKSPLRRRMASYLKEQGRASSTTPQTDSTIVARSGGTAG